MNRGECCQGSAVMGLGDFDTTFHVNNVISEHAVDL